MSPKVAAVAITAKDPKQATGSVHDRLIAALEFANGQVLSNDIRQDLLSVPETDPNGLAKLLDNTIPGRLALTGSYERRVVLAERPADVKGWILADLSGRSHASRAWPEWTQGRVRIADPASWLSAADLTQDAIRRFLRPRVLLVALYHPEWFPLPRFALGISDVARAARETLLGRVSLMDMQLGASLADIEATISDSLPDIVGISATFGQHDLMIKLLDYLQSLPRSPLVIAGGSLTARNEALLLERYPALIVARGAGETTIADILAYFHGDVRLEDVRGIGYSGADRGDVLSIGRQRRHTVSVANRTLRDFLPELDLLDATFSRHGVAQLETSRGCSSACSFCPRSHKGAWAPGELATLTPTLTALSRAFDRHPEISRIVYLVDEEIIGRDPGSEQRILSLASKLASVGLSWESSCRIDQVVWPSHSREWHVERARMWRELKQLGLRRMLFGLESGVDSVLKRFNKGTTSEQNIMAIRTLSALGVPTRLTYITFDHLMSRAELEATHAFQGRTDLLLRPLPHLTAEQIVDGVTDPEFVAEHKLGTPFYTAISYMLVSMECLIGAAYTRAVKAAGLAGTVRPSMGRVDANFVDWRIGVCSHYAQLWIDRHFALDYTAKSLEKIVDGPARQLLHDARVTLRNAAYAVLTRMLVAIDEYEGQDGCPAIINRFEDQLRLVLETELANLRDVLGHTIATALSALADEPAAHLRDEFQRWVKIREWQLINAGESCQT